MSDPLNCWEMMGVCAGGLSLCIWYNWEGVKEVIFKINKE